MTQADARKDFLTPPLMTSYSCSYTYSYQLSPIHIHTLTDILSQRFHVSARLASSVLGGELADRMSTIIELLLGVKRFEEELIVSSDRSSYSDGGLL